LGGIVGGFVVSKFGLKRTLMPTAIFQNTAILLYYFMATAAPSVLLTSVCNAIEQFAYGLGTAAYTVFLLRTVNPKYKLATMLLLRLDGGRRDGTWHL
jgi:PAT family beta-lactamase induction signal transducer AmpG